ncbi:MAG: LacI family transcriptional regulator [Clostridia bacterium]|nr:LacI family transcriptional regulator [Clostridia bacterium]
MSTMKDIANLAGVSVATVSYVLNGTKKVSPEVEERVLKIVQKTHYQPNTIAKSLRMQRTQVIGVLVEDIRGMPVPEIVDGINEHLEQGPYQVLLMNLRLLDKLYNRYDQLAQYIDPINQAIILMENARVDGIIYVAMHDRHIKGVRRPVHIPMVYAYATTDEAETPSVTYENERSAYEITMRLIREKHVRIALVAGHSASTDAKLRLDGFMAAMHDAGLDIPGEYIRWGNWEYQSGREQCDRLLQMSVRPTAIFAMNDVMATGCYRSIKDHGLTIPTDISVVGFDNREFAQFINPPLTTVELPNRDIGMHAAELLIGRIEKESVEEQALVLPCRIIERESVRGI